jgi:hypothetical protein
MFAGEAATKPMLATAGEFTGMLSDCVNEVPVTETCRFSVVATAPQPPSLNVNVALPVEVVWFTGVIVPLPAVVQDDVSATLTGVVGEVPDRTTVSPAWPYADRLLTSDVNEAIATFVAVSWKPVAAV